MLSRLINKILDSQMLGYNQDLLGIDIAENSLKLLELDRRAKTYKLKQCLSIALDFHSAQTEEEQEKIIIDALLPFAHRDDIPKNVAIALPFSSVIVREIHLNCNLRDPELNEFLSLNAEKYFGHDIKELNFDYQVLERNRDSMRIFLIAVRRADLEQQTRIFRAAGFVPKIVDVDVYARTRALQFLLDSHLDIPPAMVPSFGLALRRFDDVKY